MATVSIILPTYNRARFLRLAFTSIQAQIFNDWELIVVDDGSTDGTRELIERLTDEWRSMGVMQPVRYIWQENQGAYGARNRGLDLASGRYIAFYDSDDDWLPHHLQDCVDALEANTDVDWVYGACQLIDENGDIVSPHTFYDNDTPRSFMSLKTQASGRLHIINDPRAIRCALLDGLYNGLQNSVIRCTTFTSHRFEAQRRNEAEDRLAVVRALIAGRRIGWIDNVHVLYRLHSGNSSASARNDSADRQARLLYAVVRGYETFQGTQPLSRGDRRALRKRLARECFWHLGYSVLYQHGRTHEALAAFRRGLRHWPWNIRCWKTYLVAVTRHVFGTLPRPSSIHVGDNIPC